MCSVDGGLYGPKWLLPEVSQYPKSKIPELLSASDFIAFIQNIIMQKIESKKSFNDENVYLEKFLTSPKHIEIQVLGDQFGNFIHLGERECTIQRRHQ